LFAAFFAHQKRGSRLHVLARADRRIVAFQNLKFAVTAPPLLAALATTVSPFGWTAGDGVEFAISPNWSVKAEYLYVDFQNQTVGPGTFKLIENVSA
jgi:opacity protein-like surface antigen